MTSSTFRSRSSAREYLAAVAAYRSECLNDPDARSRPGPRPLIALDDARRRFYVHSPRLVVASRLGRARARLDTRSDAGETVLEAAARAGGWALPLLTGVEAEAGERTYHKLEHAGLSA